MLVKMEARSWQRGSRECASCVTRKRSWEKDLDMCSSRCVLPPCLSEFYSHPHLDRIVNVSTKSWLWRTPSSNLQSVNYVYNDARHFQAIRRHRGYVLRVQPIPSPLSPNQERPLSQFPFPRFRKATHLWVANLRIFQRTNVNRSNYLMPIVWREDSPRRRREMRLR